MPLTKERARTIAYRVVGFSANNNDRLDTLIAAVTCEYFDGGDLVGDP